MLAHWRFHSLHSLGCHRSLEVFCSWLIFIGLTLMVPLWLFVLALCPHQLVLRYQDTQFVTFSFLHGVRFFLHSLLLFIENDISTVEDSFTLRVIQSISFGLCAISQKNTLPSFHIEFLSFMFGYVGIRCTSKCSLMFKICFFTHPGLKWCHSID